MVVTAPTFEQIALDEPDRHWELVDGKLREKPGMTVVHNRTMALLSGQLINQVNWGEFEVRINAGHLSRTSRNYSIPDIFVVPVAEVSQLPDRPGVLEVYRVPLPLVVEIWSPSTGGYDVDAKLPEYQARGDREIWRVHPYERTLTAWRRQPDGSYTETVYRGGVIEPVALPGVRIDLVALFGALPPA